MDWLKSLLSAGSSASASYSADPTTRMQWVLVLCLAMLAAALVLKLLASELRALLRLTVIVLACWKAYELWTQNAWVAEFLNSQRWSPGQFEL